MSLNYLFIDFNSYFASVEQQLRPELRKKPVGVVPMKVDTTCCIAASYEAKKYGVKTGTSVGDAKKLCPQIHIVEARPALYVEYHHKLIDAVESCSHVDEVYSIDEMVCKLTGRWREREKAIALAGEIKKTIAKKVGTELRSSIGIAPNIFLAKTASDMQKPDGLVVIDLPDLPQCLFGLQINDLYGIGRNMVKRLQRYGITTVEQLWNSDKAKLRKVWGGIEGVRMYARLRGEEVYTPETHRSSVGHSHVLPPAERTDEAAYAVLNKLVQKASVRLRSYDCVAGAMYIGVRYTNRTKWVDKISFDPSQDTLKLLQAFTTMWKRKPKIHTAPLKVGVTLFKLSEKKDRTISMFGDKEVRDALNKAIDKLNTRFGKNTIYLAGAHRALGSAPMRIAFTHIPDLETENDE
jgi:DNA polymerase IV